MTDPTLEIPWYVQPALDWFKGQPVLPALLALQALDVFCGICLSIIKKTLSSSASFSGMSKKALTLLIVGASAVLQQFLPTIPLLNAVCAFYTLTEGISILEHAAAVGVPLPPGLLETLRKLREQRAQVQSQKNAQTVNNVTVMTSAPPAEPVKVLVTNQPSEPVPTVIEPHAPPPKTP